MTFLCRSTLRQRISAFFVCVVLSLTSLSTVSARAAENQDRRVIGNWRVTSALDHSEITAPDEREAQQLVGEIITISPDSVRFGTHKCLPPDLAAERVEPRLYLREQAHASASKLRLPNPVTVVNLGCTIAFVKNRNHLVIHWDGWFFDAARVKR